MKGPEKVTHGLEKINRHRLWLSILVVFASFVMRAQAADKGRIAFASDRSGSWQIYTMNPDGTDQVQVTNLAPTEDDGLFPQISPDGNKILFNYNTGEGPDLYVINIDGTGLQQLTKDHLAILAQWAPDGESIAFTTVSKVGSLVLAEMQANGKGKRKILTTRFWDSAAPIYTPDGKRIVFQSTMGGYVSAAWIMNRDGSHKRRLTAPAMRAVATDVSPNGLQIVMFSNVNSPPALRSEIFVMDLDGSGLKRLAPLAKFHHDLFATYSPDGKNISFASDRFSSDITKFTVGTFDILTMRVNGTHVEDVVQGAGFCPHDGNCVDPSWGASPMP